MYLLILLEKYNTTEISFRARRNVVASFNMNHSNPDVSSKLEERLCTFKHVAVDDNCATAYR